GSIYPPGPGSRGRIWVVNHGPAPPRCFQRHLGTRVRLPVERAVFLRLGPALRNHLWWRGSYPPASGWQRRAAQQLRRIAAAQGGHPAPPPLRTRWPQVRGRPRGGVQPLQPRQLRLLYARGKQRELWKADSEHESRVSATHGAAGIPDNFLNDDLAGRGRPQANAA